MFSSKSKKKDVRFICRQHGTVQRECGQRRGGKTVTGLWIGATLPFHVWAFKVLSGHGERV